MQEDIFDPKFIYLLNCPNLPCSYATKWLPKFLSHLLLNHEAVSQIDIYSCSICHLKSTHVQLLSDHITCEHAQEANVELLHTASMTISKNILSKEQTGSCVQPLLIDSYTNTKTFEKISVSTDTEDLSAELVSHTIQPLVSNESENSIHIDHVAEESSLGITLPPGIDNSYIKTVYKKLDIKQLWKGNLSKNIKKMAKKFLLEFLRLALLLKIEAISLPKLAKIVVLFLTDLEKDEKQLENFTNDCFQQFFNIFWTKVGKHITKKAEQTFTDGEIMLRILGQKSESEPISFDESESEYESTAASIVSVLPIKTEPIITLDEDDCLSIVKVQIPRKQALSLISNGADPSIDIGNATSVSDPLIKNMLFNTSMTTINSDPPIISSVSSLTPASSNLSNVDCIIVSTPSPVNSVQITDSHPSSNNNNSSVILPFSIIALDGTVDSQAVTSISEKTMTELLANSSAYIFTKLDRYYLLSLLVMFNTEILNEARKKQIGVLSVPNMAQLGESFFQILLIKKKHVYLETDDKTILMRTRTPRTCRLEHYAAEFNVFWASYQFVVSNQYSNSVPDPPSNSSAIATNIASGNEQNTLTSNPSLTLSINKTVANCRSMRPNNHTNGQVTLVTQANPLLHISQRLNRLAPNVPQTSNQVSNASTLHHLLSNQIPVTSGPRLGFQNSTGHQSTYSYLNTSQIPNSSQTIFQNPNASPNTCQNPSASPNTFQNLSASPNTFQNFSASQNIFQNPSASPNTCQNPSASQNTFRNLSASQNTFQNPSASQNTFQNPSASPNTFQNPYASQNTFQNPCASQNTFQNLSASQNTFQNLSASQNTFQNPSASQNTFRNLSASQHTFQNHNISQTTYQNANVLENANILLNRFQHPIALQNTSQNSNVLSNTFQNPNISLDTFQIPNASQNTYQNPTTSQNPFQNPYSSQNSITSQTTLQNPNNSQTQYEDSSAYQNSSCIRPTYHDSRAFQPISLQSNHQIVRFSQSNYTPAINYQTVNVPIFSSGLNSAQHGMSMAVVSNPLSGTSQDEPTICPSTISSIVPNSISNKSKRKDSSNLDVLRIHVSKSKRLDENNKPSQKKSCGYEYNTTQPNILSPKTTQQTFHSTGSTQVSYSTCSTQRPSHSICSTQQVSHSTCSTKQPSHSTASAHQTSRFSGIDITKRKSYQPASSLDSVIESVVSNYAPDIPELLLPTYPITDTVNLNVSKVNEAPVGVISPSDNQDLVLSEFRDDILITSVETSSRNSTKNIFDNFSNMYDSIKSKPSDPKVNQNALPSATTHNMQDKKKKENTKLKVVAVSSQRHKCSLCSRVFSQIPQLKDHIWRCHRHSCHPGNNRSTPVEDRTACDNSELSFNQCARCYVILEEGTNIVDHMEDCYDDSFSDNEGPVIELSLLPSTTRLVEPRLNDDFDPPPCPLCPTPAWKTWDDFTNHSKYIHLLDPDLLLQLSAV